jgi:methyl-accepting chemotaxis protein
MSGEISMACQEQANGVREINLAMGQLDQVTQRNAVSARQAAASAEELFRQADSLRGAVTDLLKAVHGASPTATMPVKSSAVPVAKAKAAQPPIAPRAAVKASTPASAPASTPAATQASGEPKLAKVVALSSRAQKQEPALSIDRTQELPDESDPRFKEV